MSQGLDLVVIPFHDWRKVQREGTRTRDAHIIKHCIKHPKVDRVVIVNRPMSLPEMVYKRTQWRTEGAPIASTGNSQLVQIDDRAFVIDFRAFDLITPVLKGKNWFLSAHGRSGFVAVVEKYLRHLRITDFDVVSFSVYAAELVAQLGARRKLFDAWDNFLRFPDHQRYLAGFRRAYTGYADHCRLWTTNSHSNRKCYQDEFGVENCRVIKNGVDVERFAGVSDEPSDLKAVPRPIIGVGAKITHLLDTDLINRALASHHDKSFVLVGQMLEKKVFREINKAPNFFYLGDKSYDDYMAYVQNFDVCTIPYVVGDREHGGDSIKFYEYLAAGKPIVSAAIEGVTDDYDNVFVAANHEEFCAMIPRALEARPVEHHLPEDLTWRHKADELLTPLLK
ncbi:MAG: glycosyltransferase family 1 protein [bacterium]|nr:glycosyltransferase family 1 protein [bacterium]